MRRDAMRVERQLTVLWFPGLLPPVKEESPNTVGSRQARSSFVVMVPCFRGTLMPPKQCHQFSNGHYLSAQTAELSKRVVMTAQGKSKAEQGYILLFFLPRNFTKLP